MSAVSRWDYPDYRITRTTWTTLKGSVWRVPVSEVSDPEEYRGISEATEVKKQTKAAVVKKQTFGSRTDKVEAASSKELLKGGKILVHSILGEPVAKQQRH